MDSLALCYQEHIKVLQQRAYTVLNRYKLDALLIHSGELQRIFLDDHSYPFKVNAHFKAWVPVISVPNCWLWVDGVNTPKLWFHSPTDYWHSIEKLPDSFWTPFVELITLDNANDIDALLPKQRERVGYIGYSEQRARELGISVDNINPRAVLDYLDFHRSIKTDYELVCMREAQKTAVIGHRAAHQAFLSGMSEFDINLAYLTATGHRDIDVPYGNIIALNEHAAVLHYTKLDHQPPTETISFLIDAGAEYNGYAADLTRTYAWQSDNTFAHLLKALNDEHLALIDTLKVGGRYTDYHIQMHHRIAKLLINHKLVNGLSEEVMVEQGITCAFLPHGLGHPLGLQVHDVAGFMQDEDGTHLAAPAMYPFLRCTRLLQAGMVLTIEPGLYFIDLLLARWRNSALSKHFSWDQIDALKPYGGIRIEDNVVIHERHIENMTRDLNLS